MPDRDQPVRPEDGLRAEDVVDPGVEAASLGRLRLSGHRPAVEEAETFHLSTKKSWNTCESCNLVLVTPWGLEKAVVHL